MKKSNFEAPNPVLIFNGARILINLAKSLHSIYDITGFSVQALSSCCKGESISSYGYYFRYVNPDIVEIDQNDLGNLTLEEFDALCGNNRRYHSVREMAKKRKIANAKRKKPKK